MAPNPSPNPLPTPLPPSAANANVNPIWRRQDTSQSQAFTHPASTGPVFPGASTGSGGGASTSTSYNLFADPTSTPTGASLAGGGTSALPSDVFIWIFVLIASGLVLLTALYRIWRLRQLNRSMSTFFRTGPSLPPPGTHHPLHGPFPYPPSDPRHPDHSTLWNSAYPPFHYPSAPPAARTTAGARVQGESIGAGGRRLDSGFGAGGDKDELPAYERGTLPGYGEVVGYSSMMRAPAAVGLGGVGVDREGWEVVEMDRLDPPPPHTPPPAPGAVPSATAGAAPTAEESIPPRTSTPPPATPPAVTLAAAPAPVQESSSHRQEEEAGAVTPQPTGGSNNPFRALSPRPDANI